MQLFAVYPVMASGRSGGRGCWIAKGHCRKQWVSYLLGHEVLFPVAHLWRFVLGILEK